MIPPRLHTAVKAHDVRRESAYQSVVKVHAMLFVIGAELFIEHPPTAEQAPLTSALSCARQRMKISVPSIKERFPCRTTTINWSARRSQVDCFLSVPVG